MAKMVLDLQQACLDEKVSCYNLLLRAYAIAEKLNIKDMAEFCTNEINGYYDIDDKIIPLYRKIHVNTEAYKETSKRWEPVSFPAGHPRSMRFVVESIPEIEKLEQSKQEMLEVRLNYDDQLAIYQIIDMPKPLFVHQIFMAAQVTSILNIVRKLVLDWALKLEKQGILGESLIFSDEEQSKVKDVPSIQIIQNWNMNRASFFNSPINSSNTINNGFDFKKISELMEDISQKLIDLALPDNQETELKSAITEIRDMVAKKDETGVRKILRKIENICQSIPGNVIAALICSQIGQILG